MNSRVGFVALAILFVAGVGTGGLVLLRGGGGGSISGGACHPSRHDPIVPETALELGPLLVGPGAWARWGALDGQDPAATFYVYKMQMSLRSERADDISLAGRNVRTGSVMLFEYPATGGEYRDTVRLEGPFIDSLRQRAAQVTPSGVVFLPGAVAVREAGVYELTATGAGATWIGQLALCRDDYGSP